MKYRISGQVSRIIQLPTFKLFYLKIAHAAQTFQLLKKNGEYKYVI